jgi:hypothetical protein
MIEKVLKEDLGFKESENGRYLIKSLDYNHGAMYYKIFPDQIIFLKQIQLGNKSSLVECEFKFNSVEELKLIYKNFLHIDLGPIITSNQDEYKI